MNRRKRKSLPKWSDDAGMTLIELIVSILILAIVMIPICMSFIHSQKMNHKLDSIRSIEVASQNLLESAKTMKISQIQEAFAGHLTEFHMLPLSDENAIGLTEIQADDIHGIYQYKINGIKIKGEQYDITLSLNAKRSALENDYMNYNQYKSPMLASLESDQAALIDLKQNVLGRCCDDAAINDFKEEHEQYRNERIEMNRQMEAEYEAACREASESGTIPPNSPSYLEVPEEYSENDIRQSVQKNCNVEIAKIASSYQVTVIASYNCGLSITDSISDQYLEKTIYSNQFTDPVEYIVMFYQQSNCTGGNDKISFRNTTYDNHGNPSDINLILMKQKKEGEVFIGPGAVELSKESSSIGTVNLYTNMNTSAGGDLVINIGDYVNIDTFKKEPPKDMIYSVNVDVYPYQDTSKCVYTIGSTIRN